MSVTEEMIDAVLARKQTIDIGGFLYGTRYVIRDHEEERKRQDTVILWELVTDDYDAGHAAATAQFERIYTLRLLEAALSISYVHGAPNPMQSTICAACGLLKNTPLHRGEMGGYVCLTCADKRLEEACKLEAAISEVNNIRNSIIGTQTVNWSEHIYPLVSALEKAGISGMGYPEAREYFGTMLERTLAAEDRAEKLAAQVAFTLTDASRLLRKEDIQGACPHPDDCFYESDRVRCGPCAVKASAARGVDIDDTHSHLPEVCRLRREVKSLETRATAAEERLKRLEAMHEPKPTRLACAICEGEHDNDMLSDICRACEQRIAEEGTP